MPKNIYEIMHHEYTTKAKIHGTATYLYPNQAMDQTEPESYSLVYHRTAVVTAYKAGAVVLNSNTWMTVTTKKRINQYLPEGVLYQKEYEWFIAMPDGRQIPFSDKMTLAPTGENGAYEKV